MVLSGPKGRIDKWKYYYDSGNADNDETLQLMISTAYQVHPLSQTNIRDAMQCVIRLDRVM